MEIRLPKLGEGAESGVVVSILVKVGDAVKQDQTIIELENEKAVAPIPSPAAGIVASVDVKAGDKITVGQKLITLSGAAQTTASSAAAPTVAARPAPAAAHPVAPASEDYVYSSASGLPPPASPTVRKAARELGLDLTRIRGTESGGRISMADLKAYVQHLRQSSAGASARPAALQQVVSPVPPPVDFSKWGKVTKKPVSSMRKAISRQMALSWASVPRVTQFDEADITDLMKLKKKYNTAYEKKGAKLTLTSFVLVAVTELLKQNPIFNASLDATADEIVFKEYYAIGIAVDTEAGLIVPVLRDVDKKTMVQLSKELQDLADRAKARKLGMDELKGGTFSISNQGGIGGAHFTPVVNVPEVAILGIGKGTLKPAVKGEKIEPRLMLPLSLSYDHRVIDGASAARFIKDLVAFFEQFPEAKVKA